MHTQTHTGPHTQADQTLGCCQGPYRCISELFYGATHTHAKLFLWDLEIFNDSKLHQEGVTQVEHRSEATHTHSQYLREYTPALKHASERIQFGLTHTNKLMDKVTGSRSVADTKQTHRCRFLFIW